MSGKAPSAPYPPRALLVYFINTEVIRELSRDSAACAGASRCGIRAAAITEKAQTTACVRSATRARPKRRGGKSRWSSTGKFLYRPRKTLEIFVEYLKVKKYRKKKRNKQTMFEGNGRSSPFVFVCRQTGSHRKLKHIRKYIERIFIFI